MASDVGRLTHKLAIVATEVYESVTQDPDPKLAGLVDPYIGYRCEGFAPGLHYGLPSRTVTMIISLDQPLDVVEAPDPSGSATRADVVAGGLHGRRALISHDGTQHGIQLGLHPIGIRRLLGTPAASIANEVLSLDDVLGPTARELHERVSAASSWAARFTAVDAVLLRRLRSDVRAVRSEVAWSWAQLTRAGGQVVVADLADEIGWSRRHFTAEFMSEFGLAPKAVARIVRFERAQRLVRARSAGTLADVAATCGYADQAHMSREFRAIVVRSPSRLLAEDPLLAAASAMVTNF